MSSDLLQIQSTSWSKPNRKTDMPLYKTCSSLLQQLHLCHLHSGTAYTLAISQIHPALRGLPTLRPPTPNPLRLRPLQVSRRDPTFIIGLASGGHSRAISTHDTNLLAWIHFLGTGGGALSSLAALAASLLLREESRDPGVVDKVAGAGEEAGEEEVEEDAVHNVLAALVFTVGRCGPYICGSKIDIGASTTDTVSLKTIFVKMAPSLL